MPVSLHPIDATSFFYKLLQRKLQLPDPDYKQLLDKLSLIPQLVAYSAAKRLTKPVTKTKVATGKPKTSKRALERTTKQNKQPFGEDTTAEIEAEKSSEYLDN